MNKYILYARKSTDTEDRQVQSLEAQVNEMKRIAERENLHIVEVIQESHSAKVSGLRPEFLRMLDMLRNDKANAILTWAPDRISRNAGDLGQVIDLMDAGKLEHIKTYAQTLSNNPYDKFMLQMFGSQAKLENDQKGENVKRGNRIKLEKGGYPNVAPIGYQNNIATKEIEPDSLAPYVTKIFELYATGLYSTRKLADTMYEQGLRTKSGKKVHAGTIHNILNRTLYCGEYEHEGIIYQLNHEKLTTKDIFKQCQEIMHNNSRPRKKTHNFTYSGFATCETCGCQITAEIKKGKYIYYHCTNGKGTCTQKSQNVREEAIESYFLQDLESITFDPELVEIAYQAKLEELNDQSTLNESKILEQLESQITTIDQRQSKLLDLHLDNGITATVFQEKKVELERTKHELNEQVEKIRTELHDPYATIELVKNVFMRGYTLSKDYSLHDTDGKRNMLCEVLSNFTLQDKKVYSFQYFPQYEVIRKNSQMDEISFMLPD